MTSPSTVESKLHDGRLLLGGTEFACQASNVTLTPSYDDEGDPLDMLCGNQLAASTVVSWVLKITAVQDFTDPDGLLRYLRTHLLETVPFVWQASPEAETATGSLQARLADWGGDVKKRLTSELEMPVVGAIDWTDPVPATGATAGTPGTWTPPGATPPANIAAMGAIVASPLTAWTAGQHMVTADASHCFWDAAAWVAGQAA